MSLATELLHAAKNGVRITFRYSEGADALMIDGRKYTDHDRKIEYSRALSLQRLEEEDFKNVDELVRLDVKRVTIDILKAERTDAPVMTPLNLSFNCGTPSPVNFNGVPADLIEYNTSPPKPKITVADIEQRFARNFANWLDSQGISDKVDYAHKSAHGFGELLEQFILSVPSNNR
jgi:hypothetical protein